MSTSPLYTRPLTGRIPQSRFVGLTLAELYRQLQCDREIRLRILDDPKINAQTRANSVAVMDLWITELSTEIIRRLDRNKRYASDPLTPTVSGDRSWAQWRHNSEVKERLHIADYLNAHYPGADLRRRGDRWVGCCPMPGHLDRTPSFVVYADQHFHCFGCQAHGDIFDLIGAIEGIAAFTDQRARALQLIGGA